MYDNFLPSSKLEGILRILDERENLIGSTMRSQTQVQQVYKEYRTKTQRSRSLYEKIRPFMQEKHDDGTLTFSKDFPETVFSLLYAKILMRAIIAEEIVKGVEVHKTFKTDRMYAIFNKMYIYLIRRNYSDPTRIINSEISKYKKFLGIL